MTWMNYKSSVRTACVPCKTNKNNNSGADTLLSRKNEIQNKHFLSNLLFLYKYSRCVNFFKSNLTLITFTFQNQQII